MSVYKHLREYGIPFGFAAAALAAFLLGFVVPGRKTMTAWFHMTGYYSVLLSFLLYLSVLPYHEWTRTKLRKGLRKHRLALILALLFTVGAFLTSPPLFRILADETNLMGVAMDMYDTHSFRNPTEVVNFYGGVQDTKAWAWGKRPLFYPFCVSLFHTLFGYNAEVNGFAVNAVAGFGFLFSFYYLMRRWFSQFYAIIGMSLLAAIPLNVLWTTSAGFEILNAFFAVLAFLAFDRFLKKRSGKNATLVMATVLILSQIRYESALFAIVFFPWLPVMVKKEDYPDIGWRALIIPLLFLAVVWQRRLSLGHGMLQVPEGTATFGIVHVWPNLKHAYRFFTAAKEEYATIPLLFWGAACGLVPTVLWLTRNLKSAGIRVWSMITLAFLIVLAHAGVLFAYYWGNLTLQYALRLGIIFFPFLVVLIVVLLHRAFGQERHWYAPIVIGVAGLFMYYWPVAGRNTAVKALFIHREFNSVRSFLQQNYPDKDVLIISDLSNLYTPFRYSAISFGRANGNPSEFLRQTIRGLKQDLIAVQRVPYNKTEPDEGHRLNKDFVTETLYKTQYNAGKALRIVRVTPSPDVKFPAESRIFHRVRPKAETKKNKPKAETKKKKEK